MKICSCQPPVIEADRKVAAAVITAVEAGDADVRAHLTGRSRLALFSRLK